MLRSDGSIDGGIDLIPGANNAGGQIGEGIGEAVGMIPGVGTVAKPIIKVAGKLIGAALDRKPQKTRKFNQQTMQNLNTMGLMQGAADIQSANQNFMEDGGWVSHDWQPQVITQFGGYNLKDLLKDDPTVVVIESKAVADSFRKYFYALWEQANYPIKIIYGLEGPRLVLKELVEAGKQRQESRSKMQIYGVGWMRQRSRTR